MGLSLRIFVAYFVLVAVGTLFFLYSTYEQLQPSLRQTSEEALVDTANLLAEFATPLLEPKAGHSAPFFDAIRRYRQRTLNAQIWSHHKTTPNLIVYVTDADGRVVFHTDSSQLGEDYSQWLDVHRTLEGQYGARTTRTDPDDPQSSVMYVAAPVLYRGKTVGVLTVGQPNRNIQPFLEYAQQQILHLGVMILLVAVVFGALISLWLTRSIRRLVAYVEKVRDGRNAQPPVIREKELARLASSTESMRREIEGKRYVENYVHNLAHEMKSPLSAVRGAVEILQEPDIADADRQRFLGNISTESRRMQRLIDRLLSLATLENQRELNDTETLALDELVGDELARKQPTMERKHLHLQHSLAQHATVRGERFLLQQAISNLIDNAMDFCPEGGTLTVTLERQGGELVLAIHNEGDPIPVFALPRLFERFYSLSRPDTGRKSTGLGLSFVREIAELHGGHIDIDNDFNGVRAELRLPEA